MTLAVLKNFLNSVQCSVFIKNVERRAIRECDPEPDSPASEGDQVVPDRPHHRRGVHRLPQLQVDPEHLRAQPVRGECGGL